MAVLSKQDRHRIWGKRITASDIDSLAAVEDVPWQIGSALASWTVAAAHTHCRSDFNALQVSLGL